jgi:phosphonate transport system substrate-binding protein
MIWFGSQKERVFGEIIAVVILFLLSALLSCTKGEEPTTQVDFSEPNEIRFEAAPNHITYAYLPLYFHRVSFERHHPLIEYLKHETGLPIRQVFPNSFLGHQGV